MKKVISIVGAGALLAAIALSIPAAASAGEWSPCHRNFCCGGTTIRMHNDATVTNNVTAVSNTGGNEIKKSLWNNSITTGEANVWVTIENNVNTNVVTVH